MLKENVLGLRLRQKIDGTVSHAACSQAKTRPKDQVRRVTYVFGLRS